MSLLSVTDVACHFGGVRAVDGVSFAIAPGERVGIIGPNGAGKTSLFNCLIGQPCPTAGSVSFDGRDITTMPTHQRAGLGLARSFQSVSALAALTVQENALLAVSGRTGGRYRVGRSRRRWKAVVDEAQELVARARLADRADVPAGELAYGEQRRLDLMLTVAGNPTLFLLDEPSAGLTPAESSEIVELVNSFPQSVAAVVIDHDMGVVFSVADRVLVMHQGRVMAEGTPDEIRDDQRVQDVYFGGGAVFA